MICQVAIVNPYELLLRAFKKCLNIKRSYRSVLLCNQLCERLCAGSGSLTLDVTLVCFRRARGLSLSLL